MYSIGDKLFFGFLITAITTLMLIVLSMFIWLVGFWFLLIIPIVLTFYLVGTTVITLEQNGSIKQAIQEDINFVKNGFKKNG